MSRRSNGAAQQGGQGGGSQNDDGSRIQIGFAYLRQQGIPLNLRGRDRELVGLGSYLVNAVGGCVDCHTAPPFTSDDST